MGSEGIGFVVGDALYAHETDGEARRFDAQSGSSMRSIPYASVVVRFMSVAEILRAPTRAPTAAAARTPRARLRRAAR